jgi:hypothetical protein
MKAVWGSDGNAPPAPWLGCFVKDLALPIVKVEPEDCASE